MESQDEEEAKEYLAHLHDSKAFIVEEINENKNFDTNCNCFNC